MPNGTWKIARGKGSAQLPLAIVAVLAVVLVLIGKAQSSLFDRARATFSDWTEPMLESVRTPLNSVSRWANGIDNVFDVYQENIRLRQENARLRRWQSAALLLDQRLKRYKLLLNAVPDPALKSVTAHVIGRATRPFLSTMILDAGKGAGVHPGEAVVDPSGMIGRVFLSGTRTSWVILLTDLNSRVPVRTVPDNIRAIMAGDNTPAPVLESISKPAALHAGDQVVTSGDGGLLPPGLPVGVVVKDAEGFRVALLADPATSEDVRIVDFANPPEQPPIPGPNDLPASNPPPAKKSSMTGSAVPAVPVPKSAHRSVAAAQAAPDLVASAPATMSHPPPRLSGPGGQR